MNVKAVSWIIIDTIYKEIYKRIYMGRPLMIQEADDRRLEDLKKEMGAKTKVQVLRDALEVLEKNIEREKRVKRWKRAAVLVSKESAKVNKEFRPYSRLKRLDNMA